MEPPSPLGCSFSGRRGAGRGAQSGRGAGAGVAGVAIIRRVLLYPVLAVGAAGTAIGSMKDQVNDLPDVPSFFDMGSWVKEALAGATSGDSAVATSEGLGRGEPAPAPPPAAGDGGSGDGDGGEGKDAAYTDPSTAAAAAVAPICTEEEYRALNRQIKQLEDAVYNAEESGRQTLLEERATYQSEIDRLKEEIEDLRRVMLLGDIKGDKGKPRRAIDIFSDILDLRSKADAAFSAHDHLPRIVVVGDQSAGKTSVLEVIVRARIFPRGLGEMMTRSPIQVTLSEGKDHTAQIKGSERLYFLDRELDLAHLRREIEKRMLSNLKAGEVVSTLPLSLDVRGPGLNPMVLVDLPGLIQHHTQGMHASTSSTIAGMCRKYVSNPNSIVLCVQDASRDPEGSGVADLVRTADPDGDRTIFVLTKVDLAEKLSMSSNKLKAILKGQKFNMKARAYFAVVTGTANPGDSVDKIRAAEKDYFDSSAFFREGVFAPRRMGTDNLARAVSQIFWDRVRDTVVQEAREVASALKKKEIAWKNEFPSQPRRSRDDLYTLGRHQVLESLSKFDDAMTPAEWERKLSEEIWEGIRKFVVDHIYLSAADTEDAASFKTNVENMLDAWVAKELPAMSIQVARNTLIQEFLNAVDFEDSDHIYDSLKTAVQENVASSFEWDPRSVTKVKSMQEPMLRDDVIKSARDWDKAVGFMTECLRREYQETSDHKRELEGSSSVWRWMTWTSITPEQRARRSTFAELSSFFVAQEPAKSWLNDEEVKAVQHNIKRRHKKDVELDFIHDSYSVLQRLHFLDGALKSAAYCQSRFGYPPDGACNRLQCSDVLLFWRVHNMLQATGTLLRLEATEYKKDLEEQVREYLEELSLNTQAKQSIISGRRVTLAEEIEILRHIQSKLDAFMKLLRKEGNESRRATDVE